MTVIKPQAPFERLKIANNSPEVSLRKAVILQAIIDASNTSSSQQAKKLETEAKLWLFGGSNDFIHTCYEAGMVPDFVVKIAKEMILMHKESIKKDKKNHVSNIFEKFQDDNLQNFLI